MYADLRRCSAMSDGLGSHPIISTRRELCLSISQSSPASSQFSSSVVTCLKYPKLRHYNVTEQDFNVSYYCVFIHDAFAVRSTHSVLLRWQGEHTGVNGFQHMAKHKLILFLEVPDSNITWKPTSTKFTDSKSGAVHHDLQFSSQCRHHFFRFHLFQLDSPQLWAVPAGSHTKSTNYLDSWLVGATCFHLILEWGTLEKPIQQAALSNSLPPKEMVHTGALLWPISRRKWWHPGLNFKHSGACRVEEWATCHALDLQLESTCPKHPVNCDLRWPIDYSFMLLLLLLLHIMITQFWYGSLRVQRVVGMGWAGDMDCCWWRRLVKKYLQSAVKLRVKNVR